MNNTDEMRRLMLLLEAQQPDDEEDEDLDALYRKKRQSDTQRLLGIPSLGPNLETMHSYVVDDGKGGVEGNIFLTFHNPAARGEISGWILEILLDRGGNLNGKPQAGGYGASAVLQRALGHDHHDPEQAWLRSNWYKGSSQRKHQIVQEIVGRDIGIVPGSIDRHEPASIEFQSGYDNKYLGINIRPGSPLDHTAGIIPRTEAEANLINQAHGNG